MTQIGYIEDIIKRFGMEGAKPSRTPLDPSLKYIYIITYRADLNVLILYNLICICSYCVIKSDKVSTMSMLFLKVRLDRKELFMLFFLLVLSNLFRAELR